MLDTSRGVILKTTNGGVSWTNVTAVGTDSMFVGINNYPDFVYFWNVNSGIAVGDPNGNTVHSDSLLAVYGSDSLYTIYSYTVPAFEIWQTVNGGTTWARVSDTLVPPPQTNEYGQANSYAVYGNKLWFGTSTGRVYTNSDTGRWSAHPTNLYSGIVGLAFRDSLHGLAWGYETSTATKYTLMNTSDGGRTWAFSPVNSYIGMTDFCVIPKTYGYMSVGLNSSSSAYATSISYSDGNSWSILESNTLNIERISVVQMTDTMHGWAGTYVINNTTGMNKYIGRNLASIKQVADNNNQIRVYPNPNSGVFNLEISQYENLKINDIEIYNMIGECVHRQIITSSNCQINLSDMSKGMYLVKIQNGTSCQIQKLIIQ